MFRFMSPLSRWQLSPDEFGPLTLWLQELLPPTTGPAVPVGSPESLATDIRVDDVGRFLLERLRVDEEVWEDVRRSFFPLFARPETLTVCSSGTRACRSSASSILHTRPFSPATRPRRAI